jgi:hypothetical protein
MTGKVYRIRARRYRVNGAQASGVRSQVSART